MTTKPFAILAKESIRRILTNQNLTQTESESLFNAILESPCDTDLSDNESALLAALLTAMSMKGETVNELVGAAKALRHHAHRIQILKTPVVDIVGTGGDSIGSFNISTTSAFVAAGAGAIIAKHGNRAVSSRCGSADVLERCGVDLTIPPEQVEEHINEHGIGFLFAQRFHPTMRKVASLRRHLGFRTMFNLLGPLTNPAGASCALIGVYAAQLTETFANVLNELGCRRALVVHGYDGMDELTTTTRSRVSELKDGKIKTYDFYPEMYFDGELAHPDELKCGDLDENADTLDGILTGRIHGAKRNIVLLNSAAALLSAGVANSIAEGLNKAADSIDTGAAYEKLRSLIKI
ncbi:MAG: anthranilate phosphoribosyltransferase [Thermoguttaceae bacterium]